MSVKAHAKTAAGPIRCGTTYLVGLECSVQFTHPILFRVIRVHDWSTYEGRKWLDGYQVNEDGDAIERRSIYVVTAGLTIHEFSKPQ